MIVSHFPGRPPEFYHVCPRIILPQFWLLFLEKDSFYVRLHVLIARLIAFNSFKIKSNFVICKSNEPNLWVILQNGFETLRSNPLKPELIIVIYLHYKPAP